MTETNTPQKMAKHRKKIAFNQNTKSRKPPEFLGAGSLVRGEGGAGTGGEWSKKRCPAR